MSGKPREDRASIARHHLGLRLTDEEHRDLIALVAHANDRLDRQGMPRLMSQTAVVRQLITREAARLQGRKTK